MSHYTIFKINNSLFEQLAATHVVLNNRHDVFRNTEIGSCYLYDTIVATEISDRIGWGTLSSKRAPYSPRTLGRIFKTPSLRGTV